MVGILNVMVLLLVLLTCNNYKKFQDYKYRQFLFALRDKLFLYVYNEKIDFCNEDYRYLEEKLNIMIKNSKKYSFFDMLVINFFVIKKINKESILKNKYEIRNEKLKIFNEKLEEEMFSGTMKYAIFGSFSGFLLATVALIKIFLNRESEKKVFQTSKEEIRNEMKNEMKNETYNTIDFLQLSGA